MFLSDEGTTLETLDFTIHISSTPTFLYFDKTFEGGERGGRGSG